MAKPPPATAAPPRPVVTFEGAGPVVFPTRLVATIKPTAAIYLGQYFGAVRRQIELHHQYPGQGFFAIADYLVVATARRPATARRLAIDTARAYLALGLDPRKSTLYRLSDVPQVTELAVIFSCLPADVVPVLPRGAELIATSILAVRGNLAPAGPDEQPTLEAVRAIARQSNEQAGRELFPVPDLVANLPAPLPGTDGHPMSASRGNTIGVFDTFRRVDDAVRRLPPERSAEFLGPFLELFSASGGAGSAAAGLPAAVDRTFAAARDRYDEWRERDDDVEDILRIGGRRAREEAAEILDEVRSVVGL